MLYPDRKLLKWQGLLLTEHREQIKQKLRVEANEAPPLFLDEQAVEEFNQIAAESFHTKRIVKVEVNTFGLPFIEAQGIVSSLDRTSGSLKLTGKDGGIFSLKDIVTIHFVEAVKDDD